MYNRYIHSSSAAPPPQDPGGPGPSQAPPGKKGPLSSLLGRLHLEELDSGDLLLIAILILLFREGEDEELLIALLLLLIL